jgi:plastocyanin
MTRTRTLTTFFFGTMFLIAACGGGGTATTAPSAAPASQPASQAPASQAPASEAPSAAAGGGGCAVAQAAGTVAVNIASFAFSPATVTAKVGDTITWTNSDSTGHTATVKGHESDCTTPTLAKGATGSITFSQAGSYDFFCKIHPTMTGTITVS